MTVVGEGGVDGGRGVNCDEGSFMIVCWIWNQGKCEYSWCFDSSKLFYGSQWGCSGMKGWR